MAIRPNSTFGTNLRPELRDGMEQFDLEANQNGFVGLRIAPALEVDLPAGEYGVMELKELLQTHRTLRNSDGTYNRGDVEGGKDSYSTTENGFEVRVDERDARMFGLWWDAEMVAARKARHAVLANHNSRVIAAALGVANTNAAGTVWSNASGATPIDNVRAAKIAMRNRCGIVPNVMVCEWEAFEHLRSCGQIVDRIKYWGGQDPNVSAITPSALAQALDLEEIVISGAVMNTANQPAAATIASMWDRTQALLFHRSMSRSTKTPQFMRTFHWGADGSQIGGVFESYDDPTRRGQIIRNRMETQEKVMYASLGQRITGVLA